MTEKCACKVWCSKHYDGDTVGLAGIGVTAVMVPATRMGAFILTATGRNELKPTGVLNVHLALHESARLFTSRIKKRSYIDGRVELDYSSKESSSALSVVALMDLPTFVPRQTTVIA
jgi:hypothetical protein